MVEKIVKDELISNETKSLLKCIGFENETTPKMLVDFICHIWMELDKLITMPETDKVLVISKKNWVGHARSLHQFKISSDLTNRWVEVLTSLEVTVVGGNLNALQRSVMARLVDILHVTFVGEFNWGLSNLWSDSSLLITSLLITVFVIINHVHYISIVFTHPH